MDQDINIGDSVIPSPQKSVKVIRRYKNRKLYDPEESNYITLSDIYQHLASGGEVRVERNDTKEDITIGIVLSALAEEGKSKDKTTVANMLEFVAKYLKGGTNG